MPRRPVREFLSRLPVIGHLFRKWRTVTLYGETLCPADFAFTQRERYGAPCEPLIRAIHPDDDAQARRLQPHVDAEWRDMRRRMYQFIPVREIPLWAAVTGF